MDVEQILSVKGRDVTTIRPDATLADAVRLLAERRIGAVVVADASQAVRGILSERDVVRAVAKAGPAVLEQAVAPHMTRDVTTCTGRSSINDLMGIMTEGKFRHVPVVEGGRLEGIVSIGDVVKHRLAEIEAERQALQEYIATA